MFVLHVTLILVDRIRASELLLWVEFTSPWFTPDMYYLLLENGDGAISIGF